MVNLLNSWKESLKLLQPKNCTLFGMAFLGAIRHLALHVASFWWWYGGLGVLQLVLQMMATGTAGTISWLFGMGALFVADTVLLSLTLGMRSGVWPQKIEYFYTTIRSAAHL